MISPSDIVRYGQWYRRAHEYIKRRYGEHSGLFCDLLAATSPRTSVKANWRSATQLLTTWLDTGMIDHSAVIMRTHLPNIRRAFAHEPLSGEKVRRFAENLRGNWNVVVLDVWMCSFFGVQQKALTPKLYHVLEKRIKRQAKRQGVSPCELQAAIWQVERQKAGFKPTSFMAACADEQQMTFWEA